MKSLKVLVFCTSLYFGGCTDLDFAVIPGSEALRVTGGVQIQSPAPMTVDKVGVFVEGSCTAGFEVELSGVGSGAITEPNLDCKDGLFSANVKFSNGDGTKNIVARQNLDVNGNGAWAQDARDFLKDTTPPALAITTPIPNSELRGNITIGGYCEPGLNVSLNLTGGGSIGTILCSGGVFSLPYTLSGADGIKNIAASQTDIAGNTGSDNKNIIKDTIAPLVAITLPAVNSFARNGVRVSGTCETGYIVVLSGAGLMAGQTTACTSGTFIADVAYSNGDGTKKITATQTDKAGNSGSSNRDFMRDSTAPAIAITSPAPNYEAQTGVRLQGNCETGINVDISGSGVARSSTTVCTAGKFDTNITFSSGDGTKMVIASQRDGVGNVTQDQRNFIKDTMAPIVKIMAPAAGTRAVTGLTMQGTCQTGLIVNISGDVSSPASTSCTSGAFSVAIVFSGADGMKTVTVAQTNAVGNTATDQRDFVKGVVNGYDVFNVTISNPRVDILFVDDNSSSMEKDQLKLGQKFSSFISGLNGVDWQIGVTTTDCSTGPYGICGSLMPLTGSTGKILSPSTANYEQVFLNTVYRPETVGCQARGDCPSSNEQPLFASMTAMDKRYSDNTGFFRSESDLAIIILSDEDEKSNSPATATQAPMAQSHFKGVWPTGKKLSVYGIIIEPGDTACLNAQTADSGGFAFEGNIIDQWVALSGGISGSICDTDYSSNLQNIGRQVRNIADSVELSKTPIASTVRVVFTPSQTITWTVQGNRVLFSAPPPVGTRIEVYYDSP